MLRIFHRSVCIILTNTLLLFLFLNVIYAMILKFRHGTFRQAPAVPNASSHYSSEYDHPGFPKYILSRKEHIDSGYLNRHSYQMATIDLRAYKGIPTPKVNSILDDYYGKDRFPYKTALQYTEPLHKSKTQNIRRDRYGFKYRLAPNESEKGNTELASTEVFFLGGSSTMGAHTADEWTVPHFLQLKLREKFERSVKVRNYGRSGYHWYQELVLFQKLLFAGHRPDIAVFMDGINRGGGEGFGTEPLGTNQLRSLWEYEQRRSDFGILPGFFPLFKKINWNKSQKLANIISRQLLIKFPQMKFHSQEALREHLKHSYLVTLSMIEAVAELYGIQTYFFWQPHKGFECGNEKYRSVWDFGKGHMDLYKFMKTHRRKNFYSLAHLCQKYVKGRYVFVDSGHYNPFLSEKVAQEMAEHISEPTSKDKVDSLISG